ncbi:hypothetical protein Q7P35_000377 [Cladosporium inversicolor]
MDHRQQVFQKLKPICVGLTQTTLALNGPRGSIAELTSKLEQLHDIISSFSPRDDTLDDKLADYIFFPISQVLKLSQKVSIRCLELTLSILAVLISQGWRQRIQPQLATQILILCTLLASDKPSGLASSDTTVELRTYALHCLGNTFEALSTSTAGKSTWQGESNMPQLGQTLSTILDALVEGANFDIQQAATSTLRLLVTSIDERDVLAGFLPGIVSKLTKVLTPQTTQRRNHGVLVECLDVLTTLLQLTVSDDIAAKYNPADGPRGEIHATTTDAKWFEQAATQLKPALASICRLRSHARDDVKAATSKLCLMLLSKCRKSLANCANMALETLVVLASSHISSELEAILYMDSSLVVLLQELLHEWLQSLPRVMQSADEDSKLQKLERIRAAYEILQHCNIDTAMLDRTIELALRDSVVVTLQGSTKSHDKAQSIETLQTLQVELLDKSGGRDEFGSALVQYRGQQNIMSSIESFADRIGRASLSSNFTSDLARDLRDSQDDAELANFWLLYVAAKAAFKGADDFESLLNIQSDSGPEDLIEEMYSLSLQILGDSSAEQSDPRLKSLALRALALRAEHAGEDFRYELIDALYPVLHTLATPESQLQQDGIVCLHQITKACEYDSTQQLIVDNVDYLTNAVALKLNAFDVSPQAPQVLLMMVQLAGPSLLPYLEDTVESIFAALEDFHGYPLLVELLFKVLAVMAEEGVKAPQLALADSKVNSTNANTAQAWISTDAASLADLIKGRSEDREDPALERETSEERGSFPQRPWASVDKEDDDEDGDSGEGKAPGDRQDQDDEVAPPPAAKTYNLLLKITTLTQHFLPSASPSLRVSLLGLIRTAVPAMAQHENSFLPLINTLWPEVTARLEDSEISVQVTALEIVAIFCEYAKDFMRSRMLQLWPLLHQLHQRVIRGATDSGTQSKYRNQQQRGLVLNAKSEAVTLAPTEYNSTLTRMLLEAVVKTVTIAVQFVPLPPEKFDEALDLLGASLDDKTIRTALVTQNADSVWLVDVRAGRLGKLEAQPRTEAYGGRWAAVSG